MAQRKYTTVSGDMWDMIAHRVYRNTNRGELLRHLLTDTNPRYRNTAVFGSGVTLTVPDEPENTSASLPPWMR